ncbi:MAG: TlpA family protein disulfide reductase [Saprospiraceae bacterium]
MRILLFLLGILCVTNLQAREVVILAKIKNPTAKEMSFSFTVDALVEESKLTVAKVNEQNEVYFILDFKGKNIIDVKYNDFPFTIFIENENRIEFEFDANNILGTIQFLGEGAANNNALSAFNRAFLTGSKGMERRKGYLPVYLPTEKVMKAKEQDLKTYEEAISQDFAKKMNFVQSKKDISATFKTYLNRKISYGTGVERLTYFIVNEEKMTPREIQNAEIRHEFRTKNRQQNEALTHEDYTNFWISYIWFNYLRKDYKEPNAGFGFYQIAEKELNAETKDWILAKILINAKKENYIAIADQKFDSFKDNASSRKYVDKVAKSYDGIIEMNDDGKAPEFILTDADGHLRTLSEFEGQVVYISYWATWCKPCLMGFRKTIAVRNQMEDLGVVLLNICLDENESTWQNTMARIPMPGINLYAGNNEELKLNYDLSKLPAYYIIGKDGNFAYLPEGSRDVLDEFRKMVNE